MNNKKKAIIGGILSFILIILGVSVSDNGDSTKEVTDGQIAVGGFTRPNDEADGYTATASQAYLANITPGDYRVAPTVGFGDGDTGFYENVDDTLNLSLNGVRRWVFTSTGLGYNVGGAGSLFSNTPSATVPGIGFKGDTDTGIGTAADNELSFITAGVEAIKIDASGNVGIGTTNPTDTLEILPNVAGGGLSIRESDNGADSIVFRAYSNSSTVLMKRAGGNTILFNSDGNSYFNTGNNFGIGTTTPYRTLSITDTMNIEPRATAPTGAILGDIYVDSDTNELCFYNGSAWTGVVAAGACS